MVWVPSGDTIICGICSASVPRSKPLLRTCRLGEALDCVADEIDYLLVEHSLLPVRELDELLVNDLQFLAGERVSQMLASIPERVPSAVLPKHQTAGRDTDRLGIDNLVGCSFLQETVLVNPCPRPGA